MWSFQHLAKMIKNPALLHFGVAIAATAAVSWFQLRPLGILFLSLLALWIYKIRCSHLKIVPPPEISAKLESICKRLTELRQDRPSIFCAITCVALVTLAIIGHIVSGSTIVITGLILAGLISTKYPFQVLKDETKVSQTWSSQTTDHDNDEFLPEVNESNLFVLQRASDEAVLSSPTLTAADDDEKSEEVPSELLIPDSIPEIDENSNASSDDELLLDTAEPLPSTVSKLKTAMLSSSSQQQQHHQPESLGEIEFKSGYFKKDSSISSSSSSDDDSISKGLKFPDYTVVDGRETRRSQSQPPINNLLADTIAAASSSNSNLLPSLVSGLIQWQMGKNSSGDLIEQERHHQQQQQQQLDSSDDSEFEILDKDDFNNS